MHVKACWMLIGPQNADGRAEAESWRSTRRACGNWKNRDDQRSGQSARQTGAHSNFTTYIKLLFQSKHWLWSPFILGGINYYVLTLSTMYLLCSYWIAKHVCCYCGGMQVRLGTGLGVEGRFKGVLRCKGWVNWVIVEINYMQVLLK